MLAKRAPIDVHDLTPIQAAHAVRERDPAPIGRIDPRLRGDIEAIVARAIEKDPTRRYASAGDLAVDLRRHLSHEPVSARAPTTWYYTRKFARRHRALVAGCAAAARSHASRLGFM